MRRVLGWRLLAFGGVWIGVINAAIAERGLAGLCECDPSEAGDVAIGSQTGSCYLEKQTSKDPQGNWWLRGTPECLDGVSICLDKICCPKGQSGYFACLRNYILNCTAEFACGGYCCTGTPFVDQVPHEYCKGNIQIVRSNGGSCSLAQ